MLDFLAHCVRARINALISGGTGAGKTTLLNVLSGFIGDKERIVTIEDAAELQLHQEHVARLETRPPNVEGKGAVRQRQLMINALRMRPDRIVVGEVRGEEALDMLQAMNTGHDGSLTTVHANTPRDALTRIETMIAMGATNLPERAMRQQIASAIQLVVQQTRMSDGSRKVTSISEITGMEGDVISMQEVYRFRRRGVDADGTIQGEFETTGIRPKVTHDGRSVRVERWLIDDEPAPFLRNLKTWPGNVDRWNIYDVVLPGVLLMDSGSAPTGTGAPQGSRVDAAQFFGCQAVTPETEKTSHYFFQQSHGFALDDPSVTDNLRESVLAGFKEDMDIILAQQHILDLAPDAPMLAMRMDTALASFRTMVEKAIAEEHAKSCV